MIPLLTDPSLLVLDQTSEETLTLFNLGLVKVLEKLFCFLDEVPIYELMSDTLNLEQPILSFCRSFESTSLLLNIKLSLRLILDKLSVEVLSVFRPTLTFKLMPVCILFISLDCLVSVIGTSGGKSKSSNKNGLVTKVDVSIKELGVSKTFSSKEKGVLALGINVVSSGGKRWHGGS